MDPSFGARLRAQREKQAVDLSAISKDTKIKLSILEGLERDDVSHWPEGIFRRAYVRAYARAIGLDPETLVREFLEAHPDPVLTPPPTSTELEEPEWPAGFRRLVTSAFAAVPSRRPRAERENANPPGDESTGPEPGSSTGGHTPPAADERRPELSMVVLAELCTRLGRLLERREVAPVLEDAALALDAVGLIVWSWDARAAVLRPSLACGYADAVLAQMSKVRADADNAIAAAFQSARMCVVDGGDGVTGAVVVPLLAHNGCRGVLAVELRHGDEQRECVQAFATILAAQLVMLLGSAPLAEAVSA